MALTTKETYLFQDFKLLDAAPYFEVTALTVNTYCVANKSEIADSYKIYWIEDGTGTYRIDFNEFRVNGSGIFCLSPGQVFSVETEKVKTAFQIAFDKDFYCVEAHGKEIACNGLLFNNVHRATVVSVKEAEKSIFKNIVNQMVSELQAKGSAHQDMLETYLRMFLIQTLRLLDTAELEKQATTHQQDQLAQDFIALVEKHFRSAHSVTSYAEKLFVAPKSLTKRLNALDYPSPSQIIKDRIVLEAKRLLKFSNKTIKEVAFELGFDDPAYFSRLFSKNTGSSPAKYRKMSIAH
ncbi:MAG: helix-turn-helix domain-containing protein [Bacteroidota bacterium]